MLLLEASWGGMTQSGACPRGLSLASHTLSGGEERVWLARLGGGGSESLSTPLSLTQPLGPLVTKRFNLKNVTVAVVIISYIDEH